MKIVRGAIHALRIPFRFTVSHAQKARRHSDAIVVSLTSASGTTGFGETLARPYVTGESPAACLAVLEERLLPAALELSPPSAPRSPGELLRWLDDALTEAMPDASASGVIAWGAARCAVELALVDLWLRENARSIEWLIPPRRRRVCYSGVVPAAGPRAARALARFFRFFGLSSIKIKTTKVEDAARLREIRRAAGPGVSLRIDANGGLSFDEAAALGGSLASIGIEAFEQPTARCDTERWGGLAEASGIPLMADESLVTLADAERLLAQSFEPIFNLRVAKLGGLYPTLRMAALAARHRIDYQIGCLVGETALLSAAGRALAAHLTPRWVEGSFGTWLLRSDVSTTPVRFGYRGEAETLPGPGLGVDVCERRLARYRAQHVVMEG